ncbi:hypothetical protein, partial [Sutterella wadsworthensis]|uniref:hypothetical protein n=1 Tax=Sutterella wadsworthensis TaxID=40545 RepID=UPI003AB41227
KYGADYDAMTVYQLPLGVAFSGNFDVNGWKLAPMVDLSVVPAFGDKVRLQPTRAASRASLALWIPTRFRPRWASPLRTAPGRLVSTTV